MLSHLIQCAYSTNAKLNKCLLCINLYGFFEYQSAGKCLASQWQYKLIDQAMFFAKKLFCQFAIYQDHIFTSNFLKLKRANLTNVKFHKCSSWIFTCTWATNMIDIAEAITNMSYTFSIDLEMCCEYVGYSVVSLDKVVKFHQMTKIEIKYL